MKFLFSSIGKKIQVAISGIFFCIFLVFHLLNNLALFAGPDTFNAMVGFLESIKPVIRIMEFGLLGVLLMHIINAIGLSISNYSANPQQYYKNAQAETSSLNTRTMLLSGFIILIFFIIHLWAFWYTYQAHNFLHPNETFYDVILRNQIGFLGHRLTAIFYIIAISLIGFHIKHGFQSALKTLGIIQTSKLGLLYHIAFLFWGIIPGMFIVIILSIQFGIIK